MRHDDLRLAAYRCWYRTLTFCEAPEDEWLPEVYEDFHGFREMTFRDWFAAKGEFLFGGSAPRYGFAVKIDLNAVRSLNISLWTYASYDLYRTTAELGLAMGEQWHMKPLSAQHGLVRRAARYQTQALDLIRGVSQGLFPWHRNMRP